MCGAAPMGAVSLAYPSVMIFKQLSAWRQAFSQCGLPICLTLLALVTTVPASGQATDATQTPAIQQSSPSQMDLLNKERLIRKGDRLMLSVVEDREAPQLLVVDAEGTVDVPLIRKIPAEGSTAYDLAVKIKNELEKDFYHQATVLLEFKQGASLGDRVTILGAVNRQGPLPLPYDEPLTVSQVILRAGGFAPSAREEGVKLIRKDASNPDQENELVINVRTILESGSLENDELVMPEDLILVPQREELENQAYVSGAVARPGLINVPDDGSLTVSKAILFSGGFTKFANRKNVKIIRADKSLPEDEQTLKVDVERILERNERGFDPVIYKDDVIRVEERWIVF